jgi:hypothetical protein
MEYVIKETESGLYIVWYKLGGGPRPYKPTGPLMNLKEKEFARTFTQEEANAAIPLLTTAFQRIFIIEPLEI